MLQQLVSEQIEHKGISFVDVQKIVQDTINNLQINNIGKLYFDVSYIYNWDLSDIAIIEKETHKILHGSIIVYDPLTKQFVQRNPLAVKWHDNLERWMADQTVILQGKRIRPLNIVRSFDKVPNELLTMIAEAFVGESDVVSFKYHAIGDGGLGTNPTPADKDLIHEVSRINVLQSPLGGSISHDGSTFLCVANHSKTVADLDVSETGVMNTGSPSNDILLDHTIYKTPIPHLQGQDAPGGTSIVFQCSS